MNHDLGHGDGVENAVQITENPGIHTPDAASPHRTVAFHGKMGLRVCYDIETQRLELWINPQAGKNTDVALRNFSNRDNHTSVFDEIFFPRLNPAAFRRCDYDSLQAALAPGRHRVEAGGEPSRGPILVATDARLLEVHAGDGGEVRYRVEGYGPHRLEFADGSVRRVDLDGEAVVVAGVC